MLGFDLGAEFPDKATEFAGDRDFDFVVMNLAFSKVAEAMTQACLGSPGEVLDPRRGAYLSGGELRADFGRNSVVGRLFDEDPAGVGIATFANSAPALFVTAGVFSRDETEEGHEFLRVLEATEGADFGDGDHGGDELKSFEGHEGFDKGLALPVF